MRAKRRGEPGLAMASSNDVSARNRPSDVGAAAAESEDSAETYNL